jgi:hypothetical protein
VCKKEILNKLLCRVCNTLWFVVFYYGDGRESNKRSECTKPLHLVNFIHLKALSHNNVIHVLLEPLQAIDIVNVHKRHGFTKCEHLSKTSASIGVCSGTHVAIFTIVDCPEMVIHILLLSLWFLGF